MVRRKLLSWVKGALKYINTLIGDVRVMFAMKKRSSIGNSVIRNKQISIPSQASSNQRCNGNDVYNAR